MNKHSRLMKDHDIRYRHLRKDPTTGIHYATVSFPTGDGRRGQIEVPASTLSSKAELRRQLQDRDAILPTEQGQQTALLTAISIAQPKCRQEYAETAGWSSDKAWFVTGRKVLGKPPPGQLAIRLDPRAAGEPGQLRKKGTAAQWRRSVGKLALASSVAMFAICVAFAAPLLGFTSRTSFAVCLFGGTRSGKTLASLCAASMTGIGTAQDLVGWRSTGITLEERLPDFMDTMLVIEDISAMEEAEREQYIRLRNFAYMLSTNQGKGRGRAYKAASGLSHLRYRTIVLTSAETSIASLAQRVRRQRFRGEELRLIDLPAAAPAAASNEDHIFDRVPATVSDDVKWRSQTFEAMVNACGQHYGAAFRLYVSRLILQRRSLRKKINRLMTEFVAHLGENAVDSPEARDLAQKFGLIYAGGVLGVELKCVPWKHADVRAAVATCFHRARDLLSDDRRLLESGLKALKDGLRKLPVYKPGQGSKPRFRDIDGFQEKHPGTDCFVIRTDVFNRLLPDGRQRELVRRWLVEHGAIVMVRGGPRSSGDRPMEQFTWPDDKRRRSLKINLAT